MTKKALFILLTALLLLPSGLKAAVADSAKTSLPIPMITRIGGSLVVNAALTEVLKSSVDAVRPDGIRHDSWPSRHTSYAFTGASVLAHELYDRSAWWVTGAHTAANLVAVQRLLAAEHFPQDVIGGALVGLASTEISYFLTDLIFPGSRKPLPDVLSDWLPSFDVATLAAFPLCGGAKNFDAKTMMLAYLRATLPLTEWWGATAAINFRSLPLSGEGVKDHTVNFTNRMVHSVGFSAGVAGYLQLPSKRWAGEARLMPGISRNFDGDGVDYPSVSFTLDVSAAATCRLTDQLALGIEAGYSFWSMRQDVSAISIGAFTRVVL